jgi:DNA polymerase-1
MIDAQPCIADMQTKGIHLNAARHEELVEAWAAEDAKASAEVQIGLPVVNPNSSVQLANHLANALPHERLSKWPRTKSGQLSTTVDALEQAVDVPGIDALVRMRKFRKLLSTYGPTMGQMVNPATGRVHPAYLLNGAKTGRLSARNPSIQNQPTGKGDCDSLRGVWEAPNGRVLVAADWDQMELRAVAIIAKDEAMQDAYDEGIDLHRLTACKITRKPLEEIDKNGEERKLAKALNFGLIYGMGPDRFRQYAARNFGINLSISEAREARDRFFTAYHGLRSWQGRQSRNAEARGFAETRLGRRVDWGWEVEFRYTLALNMPVQGSCAEALLIALAKLPAALDGLDAFPVTCVHDEILLEASEADARDAALVLEHVMTKAFCEVFPESPTHGLVSAKIGKSWEEAK